MTDTGEIKGILLYLGHEEFPKLVPIRQNHFTIGREDHNDLYLPIEKISRHHATIAYDDASKCFTVTDVSRNGTYVQGDRIPTRTAYPILHKDYIHFGLFFQFFYADRAETKPFIDELAQSEDEPFDEHKTVVTQKAQKMDATLPLPGEVICGSSNVDYRLDRVIRKSPVRPLYKATRLSDEIPVVLKFLPPREIQDTTNVFRFFTEARTIINDLNHCNIIKGYDLHYDASYCFLVMEFIEGMSVKELLNRDSNLSVELATEITIQIAQALAYLEPKKMYHRDVKPSNILWGDDRVAKLTDFGIVKTKDVNLTAKRTVMGTDFYLSPEQLQRQDPDVRTDIYGLGATYYQMLTGTIPFTTSASGIQDILGQRLEGPPTRLDKINSKIPKEVADVVDKMMQPKREDRFQTPHELISSLEELLAAAQNSTGNRSLQGNIESMGLFGILQMLGTEVQTGCLKLVYETQLASVYLVEGLVVHSCCGDLSAREAFFHIIRWERGRFEFNYGEEAEELTMNDHIQFLLLEAARIMDEESKNNNDEGEEEVSL